MENGYIPCEDTGKKTRRFTIKTTDVIQYLQRLDAGKIKGVPPPEIFFSHSTSRKVNYNKINALVFTSFLNKLWMLEPDALTVEQVSVLLGYNKSTLSNWIKTRKLQAVSYQRSYLVPKEWLVKFLAQTVNENRQTCWQLFCYFFYNNKNVLNKSYVPPIVLL